LTLHQVLMCPKSEVEVIRGLKSKNKTIAIGGIDVKGDDQQAVSGIRARIQDYGNRKRDQVL
jgi:uncharacterized protein